MSRNWVEDRPATSDCVPLRVLQAAGLQVNTTDEVETFPVQAETITNNVRVFDGKSVGTPTTIHIDNGLISEATDGADVFDGENGILMPGFIDAHIHLCTEAEQRDMARYGVTTALDMATCLRAGKAAASPGSIHSAILPVPAESHRFVQDRLAENAVMDAVVIEAHKMGKLMAQDAGVDIVTHCPYCARMVEDGRICATTGASALPALLKMFSRPWVILDIVKAKRNAPRTGKREYKNARESVVALHRNGVTIIAGTDAHKEDSSPFTVKHGDSLHHEFELLVDAGLSTVEVLQAATLLPAKHFGLTDRGTIEIGKRADLVLLDADPIEDIRHTRSIKKVWCAGVEVDMT
ncbi:amidohydrolase [Exophiala viscosa]|uniref:Amidohydrolase n=1 Tax=Exophiala viscosa TaxID=2486360 RepID=A0AAN6DP99_9EURO|nr:amidohydrolase [Exophiala viscosa]